MAGPKCTVYRTYCLTHDFVHGAEAEELRSGIERLIERADADHDREPFVTVRELQRLLDKVNARDSLAFLEAEDRPRKKRAG